MPPDLRIATTRLQLRPAWEDDVDDLAAGLQDIAVAGMLARVPHPYGRADAEAWIPVARRRFADGVAVPLIIALRGRAIGGVSLNDLRTDRPFIGYWLARRHWGNGYATEAARALLGHAFERLSMPVVHSDVFEGNEASLRIQLKLGFEITGRGIGHSLARGLDLPDIKTALTAERFRAVNR